MCVSGILNARTADSKPSIFQDTFWRAGWCLSVPLVTVRQELDPAPLQTLLRAPHFLQFPCSTPLGHLNPRSCSSLPFLAHHCGTSLSWSPRTRSACRPVKCLVFKEALSEASGSFLYFRETLLNLQWGRWD